MHEGDLLVTDGTFHQNHFVKIPPFDELGAGSHYLITWAWITHHASYCELTTSPEAPDEGVEEVAPAGQAWAQRG